MVLKVYRFQKRDFYLRSMDLTDVSIDAIVALATQKQTRMWANAQRDGCPAKGALCSTPQSLADAHY